MYKFEFEFEFEFEPGFGVRKPFETFPVLQNRVSNGIDLKWFLTGPRGVTPGHTTWAGSRTENTYKEGGLGWL